MPRIFGDVAEVEEFLGTQAEECKQTADLWQNRANGATPPNGERFTKAEATQQAAEYRGRAHAYRDAVEALNEIDLEWGEFRRMKAQKQKKEG
jgi:hypothetical protein